MRKTNFVIALLLILSMSLVACGEIATTDATPTDTETVTDETEVIPDTGSEDMDVTETTDETEEMLPTETKTIAETEVMTETMDVTEEADVTAEATQAFVSPTYADPAALTNMLDFTVWNLEDERIGDVSNLILNFNTQRVDYVLVEGSDYFGISGKLLALPFERLEVQRADEEGERALTLDVSQEQLDNAPAFDPETLPEFGEPAEDYDAEITTDWLSEMEMMEEESEEQPSEMMTESELQGVVLADELLGMTIQDSNNNDIGSIENVVIDPALGQVKYLAAEVSGLEMMSGRSMLLPLDIFSLDTENDVLVVSADQEALEAAPTYFSGELPDTSVAGWDVDIETYWAGTE